VAASALMRRPIMYDCRTHCGSACGEFKGGVRGAGKGGHASRRVSLFFVAYRILS
jgi:hypothetical protein